MPGFVMEETSLEEKADNLGGDWFHDLALRLDIFARLYSSKHEET